MNKPELESLLEELDEALVKAFLGPELMSVVGGACLLFQGVTSRPTEDVDVIIFEMMGSEESTLIFHSPIADKIRRIIKGIGNHHGLLKAYRKLHLYVPSDLGYILACKLMAGRPEKDLVDIQVLCRTLGIRNRAQAQSVVDQYFPSPIHQATYQLPRTLGGIFGR